jgi:hypothetical protein
MTPPTRQIAPDAVEGGEVVLVGRDNRSETAKNHKGADHECNYSGHVKLLECSMFNAQCSINFQCPTRQLIGNLILGWPSGWWAAVPGGRVFGGRGA